HVNDAFFSDLRWAARLERFKTSEEISATLQSHVRRAKARASMRTFGYRVSAQIEHAQSDGRAIPLGGIATTIMPASLIAQRIIGLETTDDYALSGLLYEPRRRTQRAIVWLHGTGGASIFDSRRTNILGAEFTRRGFGYFPFNNRGAHLMRRNGGMAYERIRD